MTFSPPDSVRLRGLIGSLLMVLAMGFMYPVVPDPPTHLVKEAYLTDLAQLDSALIALQEVVRNRQPEPVVQAAFKRARIAYKRVEYLTEFYFSGSAKALNGPALPEGEVEDGISTVVQPKGFQVIEELIFPLDTSRQAQLLDHIAAMQATASQVRRVANYNDLTNSQVFEAMRLEVFRLITRGTTGFDSPIARHSLLEAIAVLEQIDATTQRYLIGHQHAERLLQVRQRIQQAIRALSHQSFDRFDRLSFIRNQAYPLSRLLMDTQLALGYRPATDRRLLRTTARTLSDANAFDPSFFMAFGQPELTPERIELGTMLFYNPVLSGNEQRTCASCHRPELAFTDGQPSPLALGSATERIGRNTPSLLNAAFQSVQFMDSRVFFLEDQISDVVHNSQEMGGSLTKAVATLRKDTTYRNRFAKAYADGLTESTLKNALAAYIRSIVSLTSRTDRYLLGETVALTADEKRGFNIFMGKGTCATCHFFPLFNGTVPPTYTKTESEVLGTPATLAEQQPDPDEGRYRATHIPIHRKAFKTPTLRQVARTAPYMHNGVYQTLEQVVEFYNKGGGNGLGFALDNQTLPPHPLRLTAAEKRALVAFMKTL